MNQRNQKPPNEKKKKAKRETISYGYRSSCTIRCTFRETFSMCAFVIMNYSIKFYVTPSQKKTIYMKATSGRKQQSPANTQHYMQHLALYFFQIVSVCR